MGSSSVAAMRMHDWHPWRTLATRYPHIAVSCDHVLPRGVAGLWQGQTIWLCKTLTQAERRSTLTHELIHVDRGLAPVVHSAREERLVDVLAARRLISLPDLLHGLQWTSDDYELAEELWTDVHTVRVRRQNLTPTERAWLADRVEDPGSV
ncbi:Uncharacterised protein [Mycobacteroides abscessus subsp. bolletii]|nr:Uncharacterised protein [Mycobacteroides abscessus subsp. bolletii]SKP82115.1 Uncharacterised protein [Mycobacteroides abscessus subsp. bolletii]SKP99811.1 Uncharacterised protein [Mycobacteroides abscessus subsp. bolletii]SKQ16211.1 Uncharacterised protein [Mycobacteroides abscessus subsp. bolletii]